MSAASTAVSVPHMLRKGDRGSSASPHRESQAGSPLLNPHVLRRANRLDSALADASFSAANTGAVGALLVLLLLNAFTYSSLDRALLLLLALGVLVSWRAGWAWSIKRAAAARNGEGSARRVGPDSSTAMFGDAAASGGAREERARAGRSAQSGTGCVAPLAVKRVVAVLCSTLSSCLVSAAFVLLHEVDRVAAGEGGFATGDSPDLKFALEAGAAPLVAAMLCNSLAGHYPALPDSVLAFLLWSAFHLACVLAVRPFAWEGDAAVVALQCWLMGAFAFGVQARATQTRWRVLYDAVALDDRFYSSQHSGASAGREGGGGGGDGSMRDIVTPLPTSLTSGRGLTPGASAAGLVRITATDAEALAAMSDSRASAVAGPDDGGAEGGAESKGTAGGGFGGLTGDTAATASGVPLREQVVELLRQIRAAIPSHAGLLSYCISVIYAHKAPEAKQLKLMQQQTDTMDDNTREWLSTTLQIRGGTKGLLRPRSSQDIAAKLSASDSARSMGSAGERTAASLTATRSGAGSVSGSSPSLLATALVPPPGLPAHAPGEWPPPDHVRALLDGVLTADFDLFELAGVAPFNRLVYVVHAIFQRMDLFSIFDIEMFKFLALMSRVENTYSYDPRSPNPYHDALHAADVCQGVAMFLQEMPVQEPLDDLETLSLVFAAVMHDYRHPGVSNNFLISTKATISIRYNDDSVLENFHSASTFMLLSKPQYNIFSGMADPEYRRMREAVIGCILATDLAKGGKILAEFNKTLLIPRDAGEKSMDSLDSDGRAMLMSMVIKCADVGHPTRPFPLHLQWSKMITAEFYAQGDLERLKGLPVSPLCDRTNHNLSKSQTGFIDFVVRPAFDLLSRFAGTDAWLTQLQSNYDEWKSGRVLSEASEFAPKKGSHPHPRHAMRSLSTVMNDADAFSAQLISNMPPGAPALQNYRSSGGASGAGAGTAPGGADAGALQGHGSGGSGGSGGSVRGGAGGGSGGALPGMVRAGSVGSAGSDMPASAYGPGSPAVAGTSRTPGGKITITTSPAHFGGTMGGSSGSGGGSGDAATLRSPAAPRRGSAAPGLQLLEKGSNVATVAELQSYAVPMPGLRAHATDILMDDVSQADAVGGIVETMPDPDQEAHDAAMSVAGDATRPGRTGSFVSEGIMSSAVGTSRTGSGAVAASFVGGAAGGDGEGGAAAGALSDGPPSDRAPSTHG